jgi:hypothetical protein
MDSGEVTAMRRWLTLVAVACVVSTAGCPSRHAPTNKTSASSGPWQPVVGLWSITRIAGKPIPEGSSFTLLYHPDGQIVVESAGKDAPSFDKEALKSCFKVAIEDLKAQEVSSETLKVKIGSLETLALNFNGEQLEMKRTSQATAP